MCYSSQIAAAYHQYLKPTGAAIDGVSTSSVRCPHFPHALRAELCASGKEKRARRQGNVAGPLWEHSTGVRYRALGMQDRSTDESDLCASEPRLILSRRHWRSSTVPFAEM